MLSQGMGFLLGWREIDLDMERRALYHHAKIASPQDLASVRIGDTIRLVPGSSDKVTIVSDGPEGGGRRNGWP